MPRLSAREILASVPQLEEIAHVEPVEFRQIPSADLNFPDLLALAAAIEEAFSNGSIGVVVTQGTDTIEESAFALDLLVKTNRPIVVTGAMRNPTQASPDGPGNLLAAVRVATSEKAAGLGVLVVMNDEIHTARFVRKTHTSRGGAFRSPTVGPIGWISEAEVRIPYRLMPTPTIPCEISHLVPKVAIVTIALGDDSYLLSKIESLGYSGVVIEGFGGGHVPAKFVPAIENLVSQIPVVLASRTGSGEVLRSTYGFAGSERDLLSRGVISAGPLDGRKARILLSLVLAVSKDLDESKARFESLMTSLL